MKRKRIDCQGFKFVVYSIRRNRHILDAWDPTGRHYTFNRTVGNKNEACVEMGALIHQLKLDPSETPTYWEVGAKHENRVTITVTFEKENGQDIAAVSNSSGSQGFLYGPVANQAQRLLQFALGKQVNN